jgi:hypothetical protein
MSEHEREQEEAQRRVPHETQAGIEARRGGGAPLESRVRDRMAPALGAPLADVRIHTDTSAGTLARAVGARAFATGSDVFFAEGQYRPGSPDGERLLAHELAHVVQQRGAPTSGVMRLSQPGDAYEVEASAMAEAAMAGRSQPRPATRVAGEPMVARDFIDDIKGWFSSDKEEAARNRPEAKPPEPPKEPLVTSQDFTQLVALVDAPLEIALRDIRGEPDVAKAKSSAAKIGPAVGAVKVLAGTKKDQSNFMKWGALLPDMVGAQKTLEIMADESKGKEIRKSNFDKALATVNEVLAAPVRAESTDPSQPEAAKDDESLTQRDHDLMDVSLKGPLQKLIETTSGEPYTDWDPKTVAMDTTVPMATYGFTHWRMLAVRNQVNLGLQAIKAFSMSMNDQRDEAVSLITNARAGITEMLSAFGATQTPPPGPPPQQ